MNNVNLSSSFLDENVRLLSATTTTTTLKASFIERVGGRAYVMFSKVGVAIMYLEGQLEILASPNVEAVVVGAQLLEEFTVDGEEAAGHGGTPRRIRRMLATLLLLLRKTVPVKLFLLHVQVPSSYILLLYVLNILVFF